MKSKGMIIAVISVLVLLGAVAVLYTCVFRSGTLDIKLPLSTAPATSTDDANQAFSGTLRYGFMVEDSDGCLYIIGVSKNSTAERRGVNAGDRVIKLNGNAMTNAEELNDSLDAVRTDEAIELTVMREGSEILIQLRR